MVSAKTKILFVTNGYPTDSTPEFCVFNKEQIESVLNTPHVEGKIIFINARENGKKEYLRALTRIARCAEGFDIIHTFHGLSFIVAALAVKKRPIVASFLNAMAHEYDENKLLSPALLSATRGLIRRRKVSLIFKDRVPAEWGALAYHVPNGVDMSRFSITNRSAAKRALSLDEEKRYVLFVSSKDLYRRQKRYDRFTEVMASLKKWDPSVEALTMVNVPRERAPYFFSAADLHIITSDFEGSPNSVKEALASGTPVVSTDVGNVKSMLEGLPSCFVAIDNSAEALVIEAKKSLTLDYDRIALRKAVLGKKLDIGSTTEKLLNIYESARAGDQRSREKAE